MLEPVKKQRLYQEIVAQITQLIAEGKLSIGDRLPPERELMDTLSVSRASLREALKALELMGLIEVRHGEGSFIKGVSIEALINPMASALVLEDAAILEIVEARELLETQIAALAARRATPQSIEKARVAVEKFQMALEANGTWEMNQADAEFHLAIAEASGNDLLVRMMSGITDILARTRRRTILLPDMPRRSLDGHRRILAAVEAGDGDGASMAMKDHLDNIRTRFFKGLEVASPSS
jgi:GntR family transcriptional regulator, transcriptional repressor for pyruvate dehydrogenase complex